jgi:hypothetical protein
MSPDGHDPSESDVGALPLVRHALKSQYHASLDMLRQAIEACPAELWADARPVNPYWRIVYHALYYTHLYLMPGEADFRPWARHQTWIQHMDDIPGPPELNDALELPGRPPQTGVPYTRAEMLSYLALVDDLVDPGVDALDLLAPTTGFSWHSPQRSKLEHQVSTIRHIQGHAAQLGERLASGSGPDWVGSAPVASEAAPAGPPTTGATGDRPSETLG